MTTLDRPLKKRAREFVSDQQLASLEAELEHERSLRQLDARTAQQTLRRCQQQLEWAQQDAKDAKELLEEHRNRSEVTLKQVKQARDQALEELRECRLELHGMEPPEDDSEYWEQQCSYLQQQIAAHQTEKDSLKAELEKVREEFKAYQRPPSPKPPSPLLEEAPPTVLKELHKVRRALSDSERKERQTERARLDLQQRLETVIREREQGKMAAERLPMVQQELEQVRREKEKLLVESKQWKDLAAKLPKALASSSESPPDVPTVVRLVTQSQERAITMEAERDELQAQVRELQAAQKPLDAKEREIEYMKLQSARRQTELESKLAASHAEANALRDQHAIYQREADSLRALLKTFDELPLVPKKERVLDLSMESQQVSLQSTKEELQLVTSERDRLAKKFEETTEKLEAESKELDRVKEKFGKLRDALHAEREKADLAEQRAIEAEALAGKGSFDPERTRVLHLRESPLVEALRDEVTVLKRQIEASEGKVAPAPVVGDPEKMNQRLKETFKEQISMFREGVYMMTGYKIDMLPNSDRPTFRVRSLYGEREEDELLFKWPKKKEAMSLDLLSTDFAKQLSTSASYDYMAKFHSLPAFMASVQLNLFEKQTLML